MAMKSVNIHEAKTHLSQLVARVETGEEVIISRAGTPVAKLVQIRSKGRARFGFAKGTIKYAADFNAPMPRRWLDQFYNSPLVSPDKSNRGKKGRKAHRSGTK